MKNAKSIDLLSELIQGAQLDFRNDYSGRGMFGDECLAFDFDGTDATAIASLIASAREWSNSDEALDEITSALQNARTDSMGRGSIMYFPAYQTNA